MSVQFQDYYKTLDVPRDASPEQIQRAYRKLARQYHPDVNKSPEAEEKFKQAGEAYEVLKDAQKRTRYDQLGENWKAGQDFRPPPGFEGFDTHFRSGGHQGFDFQPGGQFSDFFESLFTQQGAPGSPFGGTGQPQAVSPREVDLAISLHEAHHGTTRSLKLQGPAGTKTIDVKVPAGTKTSQKIRLRGENLLLKITVAPDPRFTLQGTDLTATVEISPAIAALGGKVDVPTLDGAVTLNVPAGSSSGSRLRLKNKGLGGKGHLYARLKIVVPKTLTDEQQRLYEELQQHDEPST